jgi:branched-chain amino acid transport system ATP-binding protein
MLDVRGVRAGYGAINVLWDVDLHFAAGKLTTIIGPNGAGKTTLLRAIMGQVPLTRGAITLDGQRLDGRPTWQMPGAGVAMIPEGRMIFRDMSVEDNLLLGAYAVRDRADIPQRIDAACALFPKLRERRQQTAGSLSGGEAQMLAMARGLLAEPRLMLIDEPSLGLAPVLVDEIFALLERMKADGRTIVLVEQNTERAVRVADHVYLLQSGKVVLSQPAVDVDLDQLHELYFAR